MNEIVAGTAFAGGLFLGMLLLLEVGRRIRRSRRAPDSGPAGEGLGSIEGAVFGLIGLLVAFTFSGAATRLDARRHLIIDEANAIGTTYLRLDLLPPEPRRALQRRLRDYTDARLELYRSLHDSAKVQAALGRAAALQLEIWHEAVAGMSAAPVPQVVVPLLTAVNEMIDMSSQRLAAARIHPPAVVYWLLGLVSLLCALLAGYAMGANASRSWLHIVSLAAVLAITLYVIVDLEYPRLGLFQVTEFDQLLVQVRAEMR